jgi:hypothetical protein
MVIKIVKTNREEDAKEVTQKKILSQARVIALIHHQDSSQLMKNDQLKKLLLYFLLEKN